MFEQPVGTGRCYQPENQGIPMPIQSGRFNRMHAATVALALTAAPLIRAQHSAVIDLPDSLMAAGTQVKWVKKIPAYCEGPAVDLADGTVYFTEQYDNNTSNWPIWKINPANPSDTGARWMTNTNQSNGLFIDAQGRIIAAQKGKIVRYMKDGSVDATLAASGGGVTFGQVNDFSMGKNGAIYFTDLGSNVFYADAAGKVKVAASGLNSANGIEWIEEDNVVHVQAGSNRRFTASADGILSNGTAFFPVPGPDGCEVDGHGNWYMASYSEGKVYVANAKGTKIGEIAFKMTSGQYDARGGNQGNVDNCHFGGPDLKTLYCTGDGGLYSLQLKVAGRAWPAAVPTSAIPAFGRKPSATVPEDIKAFRADGRWLWDGIPAKSGSPRLPVLRTGR
jgi:sugar lactone lactonase YvrE